MSVETPPPDQAAPEQSRPRRCPRCGAGLTEQQEWCLACGTAVGTRVVSAPGWRTPIAIVAAILLIAAIALAIALVQLADDTGEVAQNPPAASPTATPVPTATATTSAVPALPEASGKETPTPSPTATASPGTADATWPAGKTGWTVVLTSESSEDAAQTVADTLAAGGIDDVGVLDSDDFASLEPDRWVVFSGVYDSQTEASDALDGIDTKGAYIRRIEPD